MNYYYGIDLGGTDIKFGLFTENMILADSFIISTPKEHQNKEVMNAIYLGIKGDLAKRKITEKQILGIGITVPGPVIEGVVLKTANIGFEENKNIQKEMEQNFAGQIRITIGNDASLAAYGEFMNMKLDYRTIVFYTLGTGLGGGIIVDGKILEGNRGNASEIGHMMMVDNYPVQCGCGKYGCLEQLVAKKGLVAHCEELLKKEKSSLSAIEKITPKDIYDAAKKGDKVANKVVDRAAHYLAVSATNIALTIDPDVFIIGGGISKAGSFLIDKIEKEYNKIARFSSKAIPFILAKLGNDAGMYGAAYLAMHNEQ